MVIGRQPFSHNVPLTETRHHHVSEMYQSVE
jgi:hypothetical protein